jgi:hypothetical protein
MVAQAQSRSQSVGAAQLFQIRMEEPGWGLVLIAVPGPDAGSVTAQGSVRMLDDELDGEPTWEDAEWM